MWGGAPQEDGSEGDDASPASRVRQRYERLFQAREREHDSPRAAAAAAAEALAADTAARSAFQGAISSAFVPHLGCAVARRPGPPSPAYESFGWRIGALAGTQERSRHASCTGQQVCACGSREEAQAHNVGGQPAGSAHQLCCNDATQCWNPPSLQPGSPARELRQKQHITLNLGAAARTWRRRSAP